MILLLIQWKEFWSLDQHYLAEKSPQSLLKTGMLRQLVQGAKKMRILVVLKVFDFSGQFGMASIV